MSREIDERVVEMQFDNQNFEKNVKTSLSTLDKLKEALNFRGVSNSFDELERASNKVDFSGMTSGVEKISSGFSALETIAVGALLRIGDQAVVAGEKLLKSLTVDQISAGWEKFSDKTTSVGTLISQGYDLDTVEAQLERLNWFTDETSYNFVDMVANIAKFTASGRGLEDSVTAMEGIANWAALSGQNAETASRAMYQLAQAMGSGVMKKEDWKSIVNANMDTQEFRQLALDIASSDAFRTLQKNADGTYQSMVNRNADKFNINQFADSLTEGAWFTSDVMMEAYTSYASAVDKIYAYTEEHGVTASQAIELMGDELTEFEKKAFLAAQQARTLEDVSNSIKDAVSTGWMNTFQLIFGNYEEVVDLWTDLANELWDVFAGPQEALNEILKTWNELGGRNDLFRHDDSEFQGAFWNLYDALFRVEEEIDEFGEVSERAVGIIAIIKEAFRDIFPPKTALDLKHITENIRDFTKNLIPTQETAEKLRNTFKGVFAVFDILGQVVSAVWRLISPMFNGLGGIGDKILSITSDTGEWLANISKGLRENDTIFKTLEPLGKLIQNFSSIVTGGIGKAIEKVREWWGAAREYLGSFNWSGVQQGLITFGNTVNEYVGKAIDKLRSWKDAAKEYLDKIDWASIGQKAKDFFGNIGTHIGNAIAKLKEWWAALREKHDDDSPSFIQRALERIKELLPQLKDGFVSFARGAMDALKKVGTFIKEEIIGENGQGIKNIGEGLLEGGIGVLLVKFIRGFDKIKTNINGIFDGIKKSLDSLAGTLDSYKYNNYASVLEKIAIAVGLLAASIYVLSKIDQDKLIAAGGAVAILVGELVGAMALMKNQSAGLTDGFGIGVELIALGGTLLMFASSLKKIADMDTPSLVRSGIALIVGLSAMVAAFKALTKPAKAAVEGEGGSEMSILQMSLGIMALGRAMKTFADAILKLKDLNWVQVVQGAGGLAAVMLAIGTAFRIMPKETELKKQGFGLIEVGIALELFADAIGRIGKLGWEDLGKAGAALGGFFLVLTGAIALMPSGEDVTGIGKGIMEIAFALDILMVFIKGVGSTGWEDLGKAGVALVGFFGALAAMIHFMPSGNDVKGMGVGILAMSAALLVLVPVLKTLGAMDLPSIGIGLTAILGVFAAMRIGVAMFKGLSTELYKVSTLFVSAGAGMMLFGAGLLAATTAISTLVAACIALGAGGAVAAAAFTAGLKIIITGVADLIPYVIQKIGEGIVALLQVISDTATQLGETLVTVLIAALNVLVEKKLIVFEAVLKLIDGALDLIIEYGPEIVAKLLDAFNALMAEINARLPEFIHVVVEFLALLFSGIMNELEALDPEILLKALEGMGVVAALMTACWALSKIAPGAMIGLAEAAAFVVELAALIAVIGGLNQIPGFTWLISEGGKVLETIGVAIGQFVGGIVGGIVEGAVSTMPIVGQKLSEFAENLKPFLETVKDIDDSMGEKIKILVAAILALTSAEITNGIASIFGGGNDFLTKFGEQLEGFAEHLVNFAKSISGDNQIDIDSVEIAMNALSMVADVASKLPNSGGLLGAIVGENDIGKFVEQLAGIGPILKDFSMDVQGINEKSIERAMDALAKIAETAQKIPNTGGIWGGIVGENDIAPFVNQLAGIGPILKDFSMDVAGTNVKGIESAMDAIKTMAEAANEIPNTGGLAGFFAGENDLGDFIKQMKDVGPILTAFSYSVQGVDVAAISNAMDLVAVMSEFGHDELLHVGSFVSAIQMLSDEEFTTDLTAFGESISSFYDAIKGKVNEVEEILEKFGSMSSSLSSFISSMSQLGADFTNVFSASIYENKNGPVNSFAAILSDMLTKGNEKKRDFEILGIDLVQSFITGTDAQKQPSIDKYADILDWIAKYIESQNDDFKTLGETLAIKFGEGIKNKKRDVLSESNKICDAIIAAIKSYYNDTKDAGKYLMDGLIKGIGDKTEEVRRATKDISRAALNTMQMTLDEHSPSTITTDFGENFGQGFVNGIYRLIPIAEQASNRLAFSGLNAVSTAIGIISDEIGDDPIQPVISPVLDMSILQNQKHLLADMFSEDTAVSVIDSLPVDRDGTIKIQNQNEQSSVVSELRSLRRDMGDMTSKMSRLQVVMDSGQLVGAISPQMDNAFGDISTRKGRWN